MTRSRIMAHPTYAEASADLNRQIVERYGSDPAVLDTLTINDGKVLIEGSDKWSLVLTAYPTAEGPTRDNMMASVVAPKGRYVLC